MSSGAIFSPCRTWRYTLTRDWLLGNGERVAFIGLNPSTADEKLDDPTIRRCINYAKAWGYSGMTMLNLFGYRATEPEDMKAFINPVGPENDEYIINEANKAAITVAAWGVHGVFMDREAYVRKFELPRLHYLRLTKDGHPGHPLYLPKMLTPRRWA